MKPADQCPVLQAVGSGTEFDESKEAHMLSFNALVRECRPQVLRIYDALLAVGKKDEKLLRAIRRDSEGRHKPLDWAEFITTQALECGLLDELYALSCTVSTVQGHIHPSLWTSEEVCVWLRANGLQEFAPTFRSHNVSGKMLLMITDQQLLTEMGIVARSQRLRLFQYVSDLIEDSKGLLPAKVDLSSHQSVVAWLRREGPRGAHKVISNTELPCSVLTRLSCDELLLCGCSKSKLAKTAALLRNQRFWLDLTAAEQAACLLGNSRGGEEQVSDTKLENWFKRLCGSQEELRIGPVSPRAANRRAFDPDDDFVSGKLLMKTQRKWKEHWLLLDRTAKTMLVYPTSAALGDINPVTVRGLGDPVKSFDIINSTVRNGSGLTGKPGTLSLWQKGSVIRHFLCPSEEVAELWRAELLVSIPFFSLNYCPSITDALVRSTQ